MRLSLSLSNVLHQSLGHTVNIVYDPLGNIFDHILFLSSPEYNFYVVDNTTTQYDVINAKILPNDFVDLYSYNSYISNNPLAYLNNNLAQIYHINSLLVFHNDKPQNLKKEDRVIINNKIHNQTKLFFSSEHQANWQIHNKAKKLDYGVPLNHISYTNTCSSRTKDILIIGDMQNVINRSLQQSFSQMNYICDTVSLHQPNIETIDSIFNQYKICIDLNSGGLINCLCACAAGCYSIYHTTNQTSRIPSMFCVQSIDSVITTAQDLLQNYQKQDHLDRVQQNRLALSQEYNFDLFKGYVNTTIENLSKHEVFII